ncbi:phytoene desaturase family protein [Salinibacterium hongtaonis]|uniref:Pyridine nucleotide-disulfide oxidoreductase domain-containing protein 2 n=1 Tax=Homoserinimonas hongtaonis TaxID=2079791 RepID=A0A2U1T0A2_9MICO|nr:NAD(P)/FAD-dependent oxidoreductase [Salinibacterium hongtaonis]PWB97314.1 dehydrogenase [Salinibacterium hongtaonis]
MIDANVVGAGPNGLAAALTLAAAGLSVVLTEASDRVGGGLQSRELTEPGFRHDVCSAVHPAAMASPFFRAWGLTDRVEMIVPDVSYAHPLDGGRAGIAWRSLEKTAERLGRDGRAWRTLHEPLVTRIDGVVDFTGNQLVRVPRDLPTAMRFGLGTVVNGTALWNSRFSTDEARAMFTGVAAHAAGHHPSLAGAGAGLLLSTHAHAGGWAVPRGGSQAIADAMAAHFLQLGGSIRLNTTVTTAADLEPSRVTILDTTPRMLKKFTDLPAAYARALARYRYGTAAAKVDFALIGPVPWSNPEVALSPTVHLGGTRAEIAAAERQVARGGIPQSPYVIAVQAGVVDQTRAPAGGHTLWAYTHVPNGSTQSVVESVTRQVERFAPGFRDLVLGTSSISATQFEAHNPNYIGGDIFAGSLGFAQLVKRPIVSRTPWRTPVRGLYLGSAATAPGPSVHGMNGWYAAELALRDHWGIAAPFGA